MTTTSLSERVPGHPRAWTVPVTPGLWCFLAFVAIAARGLILQAGAITADLIDSDDALRLIQVRDLLAGASWFDVSTPALGGSGGLVSHWSRLIDLPLAVLLSILKFMLPGALAELMLRAIWPLIVLAPLLWLVAREISVARGQVAALVAVGLVVLSPTALYQFDPGRIDHHNVMITATVSAALLMWAHPGNAKTWLIAGGLAGLALAVGYEALAPVIILAALAGLWGLTDRRQGLATSAFTAGLVVTLALALALTKTPAQWLTSHCDALSANIVVLAAIAGSVLVVVLTRGAEWSWTARLTVLGCASGLGLAAFAALEPACLAGPMGQVPQSLTPVWLSLVDEARSPFAPLARGGLSNGIALAIFLAAGLTAQVACVRRNGRPADVFLLAVAAALSILALWQNKFGPYATFALIPGLAVQISSLKARHSLSAGTVQLCAVVLVSQAALMGAAKVAYIGIDRIARVSPANHVVAATDIGSRNPRACMTMTTLRALNTLPPGLFAAHIDIGTHLAANTHHRALAGPYHRIPGAILANHAIFTAKDAAIAAKILATERVDYVLTCSALDEPLSRQPLWQSTLRSSLVAGDAPAFLVPIQAGNFPLLHIWRVDRTRLPAN